MSMCLANVYVPCKCLCIMMERAQWRPREKTYCSTWLAGEFKALKRWSSSDPHQRWPTPQRPFWSCLQETTFSSSPWCDDPSCRSRPTSQSWGQLSSASVVLHGILVWLNHMKKAMVTQLTGLPMTPTTTGCNKNYKLLWGGRQEKWFPIRELSDINYPDFARIMMFKWNQSCEILH